MACVEFNALRRGLRSIPAKKNPDTRIGAGTDASAIHGRLGAQVALLQSPILPAANLPYTQKKSFPGFPVDKPHTSISRLKNPIQAFPLQAVSAFIRVHPVLSVVRFPIRTTRKWKTG
jgi:hypothetical protein